MTMPKPIKIKICYDDNLEKITGKKFEEAVVSEGMSFPMMLHYIFTSYPKIPEKFIPTTLGFSINGKLPQSDTVLRDGDELRIGGFSVQQVREGIKNKIQIIINHYEINLSFEEIQKMIYEENGTKDFNSLNEIFAMKISDINKLNDVLHIINAAWNCFPHKCLGGMSPMEKLAESRRNDTELIY